jgi:hypothetical protein
VNDLIANALDRLVPEFDSVDGDWQGILRAASSLGSVAAARSRPTLARRSVWARVKSARRSVRVAIVIAVIAVAAVAAARLSSSGGGPVPSTGGGPRTASAVVFIRLANRIALQSWTPGPGQYLYLDTESEWGAFDSNCETRSVERNRMWVGADGSGLVRETKEQGHFTSPADEAACRANAAKSKSVEAALQWDLAPRTSDDWNAPNCLTFLQDTDWSKYSSDPQTLLQQIDTLWNNPDATPAEEFDYIEQTLGQSNPPPDVVANIYRAAALIPGVHSLGTVQDHAGRSGLGLSMTTRIWDPRDKKFVSDGTTEMIFDASTGRLLGQTDTGRLGGWYVYLRKEIVDELPDKPPVPLTPPCDIAGGGTDHHIPGGLVTTGPSR